MQRVEQAKSGGVKMDAGRFLPARAMTRDPTLHWQLQLALQMVAVVHRGQRRDGLGVLGDVDPRYRTGSIKFAPLGRNRARLLNEPAGDGIALHRRLTAVNAIL